MRVFSLFITGGGDRGRISEDQTSLGGGFHHWHSLPQKLLRVTFRITAIQKGTSDNSELKEMSNPTCDDVFVAQTNQAVNVFDSQQESNSMKILEGETLPNPSLRTKHTPQVTQRRHVF